MRANFVVAGSTLAFFLASPVHAQVTLDASKVTCDQFVHAKIGEPRMVAAWLSGFYNGKRNKTVIDNQTFEANMTKLYYLRIFIHLEPLRWSVHSGHSKGG
jgi:acid stress chaperone HdeB